MQIQSFYSTVLKGRMSIYETRVILRIVERCQAAIDNMRWSELVGKQVPSEGLGPVNTDGLGIIFRLPLRDLIGESKHKDYEDIKDALRKLVGKQVEYYDSDKRQWLVSSFVQNAIIEEGTGIVQLTIAKWIVDLILDFRHGIRQYQLNLAMSLRGASSARLYMLMSSATKTVVFTVQFLREFLGCTGKYAQTRDFIKRQILPAAKEMETKNLNGFSVEVLRGARNEISNIALTPIKRELNEKALMARASLSAWCPEQLKEILINRAGFSVKELSANKASLFAFSHLVDYQVRIDKIIERTRRKRGQLASPKAYIMRAIKSSVSVQS